MGITTILVADRVLGMEDAFVGALSAAIGVGGVVGGIAMSKLTDRSDRRGVVAGAAVAAAALAGLALVRDPIAALALAAGGFGAVIMLDGLNTTAIQRATVDGSTGRAIGLVHTLSAVWMTVGAVLPAALAEAVSPDAAILVLPAAVLVLGGASLAPASLPRLRRGVDHIPLEVVAATGAGN